MRIIAFVFICASLLFFYKCNTDNQARRKSDLEKIVHQWYKKVIEIPDSVYIYDENGFVNILNFNPLSVSSLKILTIISGDCEKCILNAFDWCKFIDSINNIRFVKFVPVFVTSDSIQFVGNYLKELPDCFVPLLDLNFKFLQKYDLPDDWGLRTFLLDEYNRVLIVGNPLYNPNIKKLVIKKILDYE